MRKRVFDLGTERPCLDIASFGRRGPEAKLTLSEVASIARTDSPSPGGHDQSLRRRSDTAGRRRSF
jgi:hypothetical protein